ncbi:MAG TPA: GNAT family N-acetyltransferase [Candidatus Limnocylindrales bacterium]|nr:GNAT family N-acetyltransferase [Candidatus Limnocylindrales bacterium]
MNIRAAAQDDAGAIAALLREAFGEYEAFYTRAGYVATTPNAVVIAARLADGPAFVADLESSIAGTVSTVARGASLYVRSMAVAPSARGRGVGRALMQEVERVASERTSSRIYLSTTPFLFDAIRLYESLGYRRSGEPPDDLYGTPLFTMAKRLV